MSVVLIVEDDSAISNQIEASINSLDRNIRILKSKEGKRALEIAGTIEVSIFIIDIGLPDCDGIELAKEIRKMYPFQPIIIESSKSDMQYQSQVHDQIENLAFLCKPYSYDKILNKINHALSIAENVGSAQLRIKQNGFTRLVDIRDIIYIEKVKGKKRLAFVLYNQEQHSLFREEFAGITLSMILNMLKDKRELCRCHKGFIINPKMIDRLNYAKNTISMKYTLAEIPIGKTFKDSLDLLL